MGLAVNQSLENALEEKKKTAKSTGLEPKLAFLKSYDTGFITAVPVLSLYNHLVIYLFLPIAKKSVALMFGAFCSLICMTLFVATELSLVRPKEERCHQQPRYNDLISQNDELESRQIAQQCLADLVFYISLNFVGFYLRYVNEINMRRGFLDKRSCIETTFKLKYEKEQEVSYFLACVPWALVPLIAG